MATVNTNKVRNNETTQKEKRNKEGKKETNGMHSVKPIYT
jgi:hypothetical protein